MNCASKRKTIETIEVPLFVMDGDGDGDWDPLCIVVGEAISPSFSSDEVDWTILTLFWLSVHSKIMKRLPSIWIVCTYSYVVLKNTERSSHTETELSHLAKGILFLIMEIGFLHGVKIQILSYKLKKLFGLRICTTYLLTSVDKRCASSNLSSTIIK